MSATEAADLARTILAGSAGVAAAWAPGRIEQLRHAFRRSPDQTLGEIARADRRLRRRRAAAQAAKRPSLRLVPRD